MMYTKICKICGKEFLTNRPNRSICSDKHIRKCVICGTEFEIKNGSITKQTCSRKCANELISRSTSNASIIEKRKKTNLERYGVEHAAQCDEIKEKTIQTNLERYGVTHSSKLKETQDKKRKTNRDQYGVDCVFQSDEVRNKLRRKLIEKYGVENPGQSEEIRQKVKQTSLQRYGVENPMMNDNVKAKLKQTNLRRYGSECVLASNIIHQRVADKNNKNLGVQYPFQSKDIQDKIHRISKINQAFAKLLEENSIPYEIEYSLENYSYDFRVNLNERLTLIEIDPSITHNSLFSVFDKNSNGLDKGYHLRKSQFAEKLGFHCIHVFDWDKWNRIIDVIKPKETIYARKCLVQEIDSRTCSLFEDKYHLQGKCNKQIYRYGLYYQGELIEVMTFGRPRYNKQYEYELLRLCTNSRYRVIGGASKLFQYFVRRMNPSSVISYCDKAKFSGNVYEAIGMTYLRDTQPAEIWSKGKEKVTTRLLLARGYDQLFNANYGKGTNNKELIQKDGWLPVYDCGQAVYEWRAQ